MSTIEILSGGLEGAPSPDAGSKRRLGQELIRNKPALAAVVVIALVVLLAAAAPLILPYSPNAQSAELVNASPSLSHPFGCDELGRDVFTRTFYGARVSIALAVLVVGLSASFGTLLGAIAGYFRGPLDTIIMRTTDFLLVFPWLLLALLLITILGPGFKGLVIALGTVVWVTYARVVRAETLKLRELEFVQAARTIGASKAHILVRHVLPNVLYTVIVLATLDVSVVIVAESGLSYLGLGVQPPTPTWGGMIADGQVQLAQSPWIVLAPAAVLTLTVIAINLLGDWLRDVLDPSLRVQ